MDPRPPDCSKAILNAAFSGLFIGASLVGLLWWLT